MSWFAFVNFWNASWNEVPEEPSHDAANHDWAALPSESSSWDRETTPCKDPAPDSIPAWLYRIVLSSDMSTPLDFVFTDYIVEINDVGQVSMSARDGLMFGMLTRCFENTTRLSLPGAEPC